jgi:hypothetical protein
MLKELIKNHTVKLLCPWGGIGSLPGVRVEVTRFTVKTRKMLRKSWKASKGKCSFQVMRGLFLTNFL